MTSTQKDATISPAPVALVNMPIVTTQNPSLGLSLLKAGLNQRNINCDVHYLNLAYAERVGLDLLEQIETTPTAQLVGDWVFAQALWGPDDKRDQAYIQQILKDGSQEHPHHDNSTASDMTIEGIRRCRSEVDSFMQYCLNSIDWSQYRVVGFTSMFQQHLAALAMAKLLKQHHPHLVIAFGGANCVADMGVALIENFEFVDVVCTGMGENSFPDFVADYLEGKTVTTYSDFLVRGHIDQLPSAPAVEAAMDDMPFPDFDAFFQQRQANTNLPDENLSMLVETSRGCWWGAKHHCTFCGLNASTIGFRFKSSERALAEFRHLIERYGHHTHTIAVVDNIMPTDYLRGFLQSLRDSELDLDLFYETKANLKKEHIALYKAAGLSVIQPGVESFNNRLLKLMDKGITGLQNVQFLKWCREYSLRPMWNYMVGFPGENQQDHEEQLQLMPKLGHLYPPDVSWVRIDKFSPYQRYPERYGITNLRPFGSYQYLYPDLSAQQQSRMAYYFVTDFDNQRHIENYADQVKEVIDQWRDGFMDSALFHVDTEEVLCVVDCRGDRDHVIRLTGQQRQIYELCDQIRNAVFLAKTLNLQGSDDSKREQIGELTLSMIEQGILVRDGDRYLSLSVSLDNGFFPPMSAWPVLNEVLSSQKNSTAA
ncbi:MAG: RiPP maturation radical SAM C-methyltransferase [Cellvibrionaceae bacterium]